MLARVMQLEIERRVISVSSDMRLLVLILAATLTSVTAGAQEIRGQGAHADGPVPFNLPISLDKIRQALSKPAEPLKGVNITDQPTFHVDITEQQKFEEMLSKIHFETGGPQVVGGNYAYEEQRRLFPPIANPLVQPYAAFKTGELATIAVEGLVEKFVAEPLAHSLSALIREKVEREAREEVARALAEYWAARAGATRISANSAETKE